MQYPSQDFSKSKFKIYMIFFSSPLSLMHLCDRIKLHGFDMICTYVTHDDGYSSPCFLAAKQFHWLFH